MIYNDVYIRSIIAYKQMLLSPLACGIQCVPKGLAFRLV